MATQLLIWLSTRAHSPASNSSSDGSCEPALMILAKTGPAMSLLSASDVSQFIERDGAS